MPIMRPTGCRSATVRLRRGNDRRPTRSAPAMRRHQEPRNLGARRVAAVLSNRPPMRKKGRCRRPAPARGYAACGILSGGTLGENVGAARSRTRTGRPCCRSSSAGARASARGSGLGFGVAHQPQAWRTSSRVTRQTSDSFREGGSRRTAWSNGPSRGLISATSSVRVTHPCRCPSPHKVGRTDLFRKLGQIRFSH
jgi:hypothetical protein